MNSGIKGMGITEKEKLLIVGDCDVVNISDDEIFGRISPLWPESMIGKMSEIKDIARKAADHGVNVVFQDPGPELVLALNHAKSERLFNFRDHAGNSKVARVGIMLRDEPVIETMTLDVEDRVIAQDMMRLARFLDDCQVSYVGNKLTVKSLRHSEPYRYSRIVWL